MAENVQFVGLTEIKADLKKLKSLLKRNQIVNRLAADARNLMVERTLRGKNVDFSPFKRYSAKPIYIAKSHRPSPQGGRRTRKGSGKPLKTVFYEGGYAEFVGATKATRAVNLFATGDMMRAFQPRRISDTRAAVEFTRRLPALKALANNAVRRFVGINTRRELPILERTFGKFVDEMLRRANLT